MFFLYFSQSYIVHTRALRDTVHILVPILPKYFYLADEIPYD